MNKKKAIKIATASAIAASGFVAVAPAQAATNSVDKAINSAITSMKTAYNTYNKPAVAGEVPSAAKVRTATKNAHTAYDKAKAEIKKNGGTAAKKAAYTKKLDAQKYYLDRADKYVAATNINIKTPTNDLTTAIEGGTQSKVLKAYNALNTKIETFEKAVANVYGPKVRDLLTETYITPAKEKTASVNDEMAVYKAYKQIQDEKLIEKDLEKAGKIIADTKTYVEAISKKEGKLVANLLKVVKTFNEQYEAALVPTVTEVTATSATKVEIKFNTAISSDSVFANGQDGTLKTGTTVSLNSIDSVPAGTPSYELSEDGKTLTVTTTNALSKRYDVVVDGLKGVNGKALTKYQDVVTFAADTTAPTIVGTEKLTANTVKVKFSEPLKAIGNVSFKLADGTTVTGITDNFATGAKEVTFTLTNAVAGGSAVAAGKDIVITFIGAQDQASNLINPHPASVTVQKGDKDGVKPTVTSVVQTGAKTFEINFTEELATAPAVTVGTTAAASVAKDKTDSKKYVVTTTDVLDGVQNVAISGYVDLSGEAGDLVTKVVTFTKDAAAPKVSNYKVVKGTDNKEYLELTFDKAVTEGTVSVAGSYVKDYVTTPVASTTAAATYADASNKNVLRIQLASIATVKEGVYSLAVTFTGVNSATNIGAEKTNVTFTRGEDGAVANTDKLGAPTITADADNNNKVKVTFPAEVDGASATNVANYSIDGAVIESVSLLPVNGTTQTAVVNLKAGSNAFTGVRNITVQNVKKKGSSVTMDKFTTNSVSLNENVAPTVTSAKLTANDTITLTYSEAVVTTGTGEDFEVLYGGKSVATPVKRNATTTITIPTVTATELAQGLSLKALDSLDIVDNAGNKLSVPANITVSQ